MTIYNVAAFVGTSVVAAWFVRPRGDRFWFTLTLAPLIVLGINLVWRQGRISFGPPAPIDLAFSLSFVVILWLVFSRGGNRLVSRGGNWLVSRLARSRYEKFQFDRQLYATIKPLGRPLWARAPRWQDSRWTPSDIAARERAIGELEALQPPSADWGEIRDQYRRLTIDEIETMPRGPSPSEVEALQARTELISARLDELQVAYRISFGRRSKRNVPIQRFDPSNGSPKGQLDRTSQLNPSIWEEIAGASPERKRRVSVAMAAAALDAAGSTPTLDQALTELRADTRIQATADLVAAEVERLDLEYFAQADDEKPGGRTPGWEASFHKARAAAALGWCFDREPETAALQAAYEALHALNSDVPTVTRIIFETA
jgi:hypothetical protein